MLLSLLHCYFLMIAVKHCLHSQHCSRFSYRAEPSRLTRLGSVYVWCLVTKWSMSWEREGERRREGGLESTGEGSSDLTTWGKPHQGHWSHTEHTSLTTQEFHCCTDTNQSHSFALPEWIILILVWQKVKCGSAFFLFIQLCRLLC